MDWAPAWGQPRHYMTIEVAFGASMCLLPGATVAQGHAPG